MDARHQLSINFSDFNEGDGDHEDLYKEPEVDEKDVIVLKGTNFSDTVEKNRFVMVEFYALWCEHYQALAPEYAAAATALKGENRGHSYMDQEEDRTWYSKCDHIGRDTTSKLWNPLQWNIHAS
ncbi:hypothetical protein GBA52_014212 [Prunus armeniaca]|nr:hypothetical protein GBA52_014212 [Prunus armeniaca]